MKIIKYILDYKHFFLVVALVLIVFTLSSCAKKVVFETSTITPAARGEVKVKKDDNNNYNIELKVDYLTEPGRLTPAKRTYVVWLVSENNDAPINLGQIIGTKKLKLSFESVSASRPKRIFITAEDDASIQFPSSMIVLETDSF